MVSFPITGGWDLTGDLCPGPVSQSPSTLIAVPTNLQVYFHLNVLFISPMISVYNRAFCSSKRYWINLEKGAIILEVFSKAYDDEELDWGASSSCCSPRP